MLKKFLSMGNLKVVSNLKAREIVNDSSEVVYGDLTQRLPEHLNGLGHKGAFDLKFKCALIANLNFSKLGERKA